MKIKTDPTIQSMSGRFPGSRLVMINPKGKLITNARAHVIPDNIAQQEAFAAKVAALVLIWNAVHADFEADAELYKAWYNANVITNEEMKVSAYALFIKACFITAEERSVDLTTVTLATFEATLTGGLGAFLDFFTEATGPALTGSVAQVGADLNHHISTGAVVSG
ncbi:MAG: hypothetical protein HQ534_01470 [Armatimonadetes bacterium]|nr:hypothetical protein [Armatimonadota bacterium]